MRFRPSRVSAHRPSAHRTAILASRASSLRAAPTATEALLWQALSGSKLGVRFQRQVVLGDYIADFVAPSLRLVVEVDGGYHADRLSADARRDRALARLGYRVLRVSADDVRSQFSSVLRRILAAIA